MDDMDSYTPNFKIHTLFYFKSSVFRIFRGKKNLFFLNKHTLKGEFSIKYNHDYALVGGFARPVYHDEISFEYTSPYHRVSCGLYIKGCTRIFNQMLIEIKCSVQEIICGRREASSDF